MAPIIRELEIRKADFFVLHTGQHYSYELDKVFFEQLELPLPRYNLNVGSGSHAEQTGKILIAVEKVLLKEKPDVILVEGDTNSVLAGALAAAKLGIKVGHVESGLRSYDRNMPEELNRVLTDHISDYLYAPTPKARETLLAEGIPEVKISVTGNTIVDAVHQNLELSRERPDKLRAFNLKARKYFVLTLHRQENVDNRARFSAIMEGLDRVATEFGMPVIYPMHPRSRKMMAEFGLQPRHLTLIEPLDFFDFLQLENGAKLIFTDSGGVQEEACILGIPCVTLRDNTERPETLEVGANILAGALPENIVKCAQMMIKNRKWRNPFGDGTAAKRIIAELMKKEHI